MSVSFLRGDNEASNVDILAVRDFLQPLRIGWVMMPPSVRKTLTSASVPGVPPGGEASR